ncbi:MAG: signal recognition particle subunit SRP19/SEC65 family protein [Candidatus Bathyarchaeia archaeon]
MRKTEKIIIWPAYFDSTKTRKEGRRVPKNFAVPSPKILELKEAVEKIGLEYEIVSDSSYPKMPWLKTGMLLVKKKEAKAQIIKKISKQLTKIRSVAATK